jgi:hypothetical protein
MSNAPKQLRLAMLAAMSQWCASVNVPHATTNAEHSETSISCSAFFVAFCMTGVLVVGGIISRKNRSS